MARSCSVTPDACGRGEQDVPEQGEGRYVYTPMKENTGRDREREREETLQRFFGTVASPGSARPPLGHRGDGGRPPRARARRPRDAPAARRSLGGAAAASPPRREGAPDAERPGYLRRRLLAAARTNWVMGEVGCF
ncbi:unnamed protein product [Prorocentrum cordatum]|uniref:Uncharacterized protein n=1 Tax=Prorocentrum cordatum TaxID=2364126 RepID=A0ABN9W6V0_9DINO|nr:unnamed protein product [Polarella glacialis]